MKNRYKQPKMGVDLMLERTESSMLPIHLSNSPLLIMVHITKGGKLFPTFYFCNQFDFYKVDL